MLSGNNQTGTINTPLPGPLVVSLTNDDGSPASGETVIFKVIQNNGTLTGSGPASSLAEVTDANGVAFVLHTLGSTSGVGNNKVEATAVEFTGKVVFTASATEKPPNKINIGSGNNQRGAVNTLLPRPLVAVVTDEGHNVIQGVPVTFTVVGVGGNINGSDSVVVNTDSDGRATASLTLGPVEGLDNNQVEADFAGNTTGAAVFRASGLSVGAPGDTSISGIVLDNSNIPIPGVTMRVEGTTREAVTDDEGQFLIANVPVGPLHLIADGSTAIFSDEYPVLSFEIVTVAGQNNTLGMPIYLLPLNTTNTQWVGGNEDVVYTLENIPGFSLTVKANSVTFPDGSNEGFISVTQVHADKVPMEPPNGLQPRFIITIQPPGAVFDPPAPITIPNVDGLAPGEITKMYSFDHDMGQFVVIGTGTISEDGSVIKSDPGVGIIKTGWHCGGNPQRTGCLHNCPPCWTCRFPECICNIPLPDCDYCEGADCPDCEGPDCETCKGADCPDCEGPDCETCKGADCPDCEGPDCKKCKGADCHGCKGPDCETCKGADCEGCDGEDCETCEGEDCEKCEDIEAILGIEQQDILLVEETRPLQATVIINPSFCLDPIRDGVYTWETSDISVVNFVGQDGRSVIIKGVSGGKANIKLTVNFPSVDGLFASFDVQIQVVGPCTGLREEANELVEESLTLKDNADLLLTEAENLTVIAVTESAEALKNLVDLVKSGVELLPEIIACIEFPTFGCLLVLNDAIEFVIDGNETLIKGSEAINAINEALDAWKNERSTRFESRLALLKAKQVLDEVFACSNSGSDLDQLNFIKSLIVEADNRIAEANEAISKLDQLKAKLEEEIGNAKFVNEQVKDGAADLEFRCNPEFNPDANCDGEIIIIP